MIACLNKTLAFSFFFSVKVDALLSSADVKFLLTKGEGPLFQRSCHQESLSLHIFYEPQSPYITNQSESAKETVRPKIGKNI